MFSYKEPCGETWASTTSQPETEAKNWLHVIAFVYSNHNKTGTVNMEVTCDGGGVLSLQQMKDNKFMVKDLQSSLQRLDDCWILDDKLQLSIALNVLILVWNKMRWKIKMEMMIMYLKIHEDTTFWNKGEYKWNKIKICFKENVFIIILG